MHILHIIGSFDKKNGGTYSAILSITSIENKLGFTNEILSIFRNNQEYDDIFKNKISLHKPGFPDHFSTSPDAIGWLKLNISKYDLLVLHEVWSVLAVKAAIVAKQYNRPYVIWPHGSLDPFDLNKKKNLKVILGNLILKNILKHTAAICCTSTLESELLECYCENPLNKKVLPLPIDFNLKGHRQAFRKNFSISEESFVFLFLSRVDYKKGLDIFLKSLAVLVRQDNPDIKLVVAGNGTKEYEMLIRKMVEQLGLSEQVIEAGFLSGIEKADAFAGADCFILPSQNENYGISIIEALQSNLPVLISDNVYIWKNIMPEAGWVCQYNEESILNSIRKIYGKSRECTENKKAPQKQGDKFRMTSLISAYKDFYLEIYQENKISNA